MIRGRAQVAASRRGFTLVELMIVVAIIGVISAIGAVSYGRFVKTSKIHKLESYAMKLSASQEQFRSKNGGYAPLGANELSSTIAGHRTAMKLLLNLEEVEQLEAQGVRVYIGSGEGDGSACGYANACPPETTVDTTEAWYSIVVTQDLNPSNVNNTMVVINSTLDKPIVLHEGL